MKYKSAVFSGLGVIAGFLIASFFDFGNKPSALSAAPTIGVKAAGNRGNDGARQIAALNSEIEDLRRRLAESPDAKGPTGPAKANEFVARQMAVEGAVEAARRQREHDQLIAAGFSPQRIEWAARRTEELLVQQQQDVNSRRDRGIAPDPFKSLAYVLDPDLDLRNEMGEQEYERYRRALGRPDGVRVTGIVGASNAELAGLKAGDEILRYDGRRVYNLGMLDELGSANTSSAAIEARRDGQTVILSISKGRVGVRIGGATARAARTER